MSRGARTTRPSSVHSDGDCRSQTTSHLEHRALHPPLQLAEYQAAQKRAGLFAQAQGSQILWVRAVDVPNTNEEKGMNKSHLEELRNQWLQLHDRNTGGVMGLLPLYLEPSAPLYAHT